MLLKESWIYVTDNTNVRWVKIFQLYKGFHRKSTTPGFFVKGAARVVEPPRLEYKGFKYKYSIKGDIIRLYFVRSTSRSFFHDSAWVSFRENCGISIKKKQDPKSKFLNGPIARGTRRKRLMSLFKNVV